MPEDAVVDVERVWRPGGAVISGSLCRPAICRMQRPAEWARGQPDTPPRSRHAPIRRSAPSCRHQQRRRVLPREPAIAGRPHSQARRGATDALGACGARARQRAGVEPMHRQGGRAAAGAPAFVDQGSGLVPAASAGGSLQCPSQPHGSGLPTAPCRVRASPAAGIAGRAAASAAHGDARTLRRSCSWREEIARA